MLNLIIMRVAPIFMDVFLMVINGLHMKTMKEENMKI